MKNAFVLAVVVSTLVTGCGKSSQEKKAEADLNGEIMKLHEFSMASMRKMSQVDESLDSAISRGLELRTLSQHAELDSLLDALHAGKLALARADSSMEDWMQNFQPYDPQGDHETVMAGLKEQKELLARTTADALSAIDTATAALDRFRASVDGGSQPAVRAH